LCWGYIVAFTKVLTMYQIYHTWIYSLHRSPLVSHHQWHKLSIIPACLCTFSSCSSQAQHT
jgi:uncharacterized protein YqgQ